MDYGILLGSMMVCLVGGTLTSSWEIGLILSLCIGAIFIILYSVATWLDKIAVKQSKEVKE